MDTTTVNLKNVKTGEIHSVPVLNANYENFTWMTEWKKWLAKNDMEIVD